MNKITRIYIIRHGESVGNVNGNFNGSNNLPLNEKGIAQAKALHSFIKTISYDSVYSSALDRAIQTAKYSLQSDSVKINIIKEINEIDGGDWEKSAWISLPQKWPIVFENWINHPELLQMPNGESMVDFSKRCITAFKNIIDKNKDKTILVYTHGTVIKVMQTYFKKAPLKSMKDIIWHENTGVFGVDIYKDQYKIIKENNISHLPKNLRRNKTPSWHKELKNWVEKNKL